MPVSATLRPVLRSFGGPGALSRRCLLAASVLSLAACGGDAGGSGTVLEAVVDTVEGVERLSYPAQPAARLAWSFDTTSVIGGFGADDPDYQFGALSATSLAGDADGKLYVLDADGIRVLGYGPDGSFLGSWGREGEGPGELGGGFGGGPRAMAMGPGDTLWINDRSNQRLTLIPLDGGEATSLPLPQTSSGLGALSVDADGVTSVLSSFRFGPGDADDGIPPRPLIRLDRDDGFEAADTLWTGPPPPSDLVTLNSGGRRLMMIMSQQFAPSFFWKRFSDGGLVVHQTAAYELRFLDADGRTERILHRDPPPRLTTDADRQRYLDSLLAPPEEESNFNNEEIRRERADATTFADSIPRVVNLRRDTQDRLWVGVSVETPGQVERIDIYERDGTLVGELHDTPLPYHFFGDEYAAFIDQDELDVARVHIARLIEDPEALESAATTAAAP